MIISGSGKNTIAPLRVCHSARASEKKGADLNSNHVR
jgi:hypothetical protein